MAKEKWLQKKMYYVSTKKFLINVNKSSTCLDWFKRCVYNEDYVLLDDK